MRIVIVEDQPALCNGLAKRISRIDPSYQIVGKAFDGHQGENMIRLTQPDLAFVDICMPFQNGLQLLERMNMDKKVSTKFVILTAYTDFTYMQSAVRLDAFDYLLKPIASSSLIQVMLRFQTLMEDSFSTPDTYNETTNEYINDVNKALYAQVSNFADQIVHDFIQANQIRNQLVLETIFLIREEYMMELTLNTISLRLNTNENHLCRIFSRECKKSLIQYINDFRIRLAMQLMCSSNIKISDISLMVGYNNLSYFGKVFKKIANISASEFRQIQKKSFKTS